MLGYQPRAGTRDMELNDLHNRWPIVCFGHMDAPWSQRNRIHFVWAAARPGQGARRVGNRSPSLQSMTEDTAKDPAS